MSREMGVGRGVLQHHLRILETHRLVVARAVGRVRTYYPSGGPPDAETARVDAALKDATRARVLREIRASPQGLTQRELVERTGLSQRLVSYHLARLLAVGLVQGREGRPRRFAAVPEASSA
jgi:predicted transcriptional regulator